jgi:hypothetical protein
LEFEILVATWRAAKSTRAPAAIRSTTAVAKPSSYSTSSTIGSSCCSAWTLRLIQAGMIPKNYLRFLREVFLIGAMDAPQPDLKIFLTVVSGGCALVIVGRCLVLSQISGYGWLFTYTGGLLVLLALWCLVAAVAPRFTRSTTVLAISCLFFLSFMACWIDASREQARRMKCNDNLRRLGFGLHELSHLTPDRGVDAKTTVKPISDNHAFLTGGNLWQAFPAAEPAKSDERTGF